MLRRVTELDHFLRREIELGTFPSASYAIGTADGIERVHALGRAVSVPLRLRATTETIYDCASITKPLITGTLVLQAVAERKIALDDEYRGFRFRELLSHSSGLRPWLPLYAHGDYLQAIETYGREAAPGERVMYSDLNFVVLYHALLEIFGDYVEAARVRIFEPLGLRDSSFNPPSTLLPRIAATEWGQRFERVLRSKVERDVEDLHTWPPSAIGELRQGLMWGEANDGNSFHAGGTCGNAGLFATARDVFRIAQGFVRGELVPRALAEEATRAHAGDRGLSWQIGGPGLSPRSFGHMGFTGTSVWVDGARIMVLLTNRIHPCAASLAMQPARTGFHRRALL
jgi:CubicO group peptidase (beta-lactamase class C family)